MEVWLLAAFSIVFIAVGVLSFVNRNRILGAVALLCGVIGLAYLVYTRFQGIPLPEIPPISWTFVSGVLGVSLLAAGLLTYRLRIASIGLGFMIWFLYLVLTPSIWFLILGLIAAALFTAHGGDGRRVLALVASIALFASVIVGATTANNPVAALRAALLEQIKANNDSFESWDALCAQADPTSAQGLTCAKVNGLQTQVDTNTKAIETLSGRVATVEERDTGSNIVINSNPGGEDSISDQDAAAATALAGELAKAGWSGDDLNINTIDESIKSDQQGAHAFGERIRTKSQLVAVLNGSSTEQTAIRDRVLNAVPESEHSRLLAGDGYYAIQLKKPVCLSGSDYFKDGVAYAGDGGVVCYDQGDVLWVYVGSDGVVYWGATIRDDCNNPHLDSAPAPQGSPAAELCPEGTDRAGQMVGSGCDYPDTPPASPPSEEQPPTTMPPSSETPPNTTSTTPPSTTDTPPSSTTPPSTTETPPTSTTSTPPSTTSTPPTSTTSTPPSTTPPSTTTLESKTGYNTAAVTTGRESHSVNTNDGSTDSQGYQDDPGGDASSAASSAAASASSQSSAASSAASQADTDSGGGPGPHGSVTVAPSNPSNPSTGSAGEDTSGGAWG